MTPNTINHLRFLEAHLLAALSDAQESGDAMDQQTAAHAHGVSLLVLLALDVKPWSVAEGERHLKLVYSRPECHEEGKSP